MILLKISDADEYQLMESTDSRQFGTLASKMPSKSLERLSNSSISNFSSQIFKFILQFFIFLKLF